MLTPRDGFVDGSALRMPHQCTREGLAQSTMQLAFTNLVRVFKL